jgi:hypothetical protein
MYLLPSEMQATSTEPWSSMLLSALAGVLSSAKGTQDRCASRIPSAMQLSKSGASHERRLDLQTGGPKRDKLIVQAMKSFLSPSDVPRQSATKQAYPLELLEALFARRSWPPSAEQNGQTQKRR